MFENRVLRIMSNGSLIKKRCLNVEPGELKQYLQALRSDILEDVDTKLQKGIDKITLELELKHRKSQNGYIEKSSVAKKSSSPKEFPQKEFVLRNSNLTNLWENADICSAYNAIFALFVVMYLYIVVFYYFNVQRLKRDLAVVSWTFSQFHIVTAIWLSINLSTVFLLHPSFRFWATSRTSVKKKGLYDVMFCCLFILYEAALLIIPLVLVIYYNLPPVSSLIVLVEKIRICMKIYSFVRENVAKALKYKPHQDGDKEDSYTCPKVEKLIYFLFAPTAIYRDTYPRTSHIRWNFVAWNILQMFCTIICLYISYICFGVGTLSKAGVKPIPLNHFIGILVVSIFAGCIVLIGTFYLMLHCWYNFMAEILRFGDRMFYDDWWSCTSYAQYYRSWNIPVHDWLYSYIYRDMHLVWGRSRTGAMLTVFWTSAIVHEYILAFTFKSLFPLLFIFFSVFGVALVFITRKSTSTFWNVFLWFSLLLGIGLLLVFYTLEYYARINCPRILDSWVDYVVPRSLNCNVISFSSQVNSLDWYPSDC